MSSPHIEKLPETTPFIARTREATLQEAAVLLAQGEPTTCPPLTKEQQEILTSLRGKMAQGFRLAVEAADLKSEKERRARIEGVAKEQADLKKDISTGLGVAAGVVNAIPVAGQVVSAILAVAAALNQLGLFRAAQGPVMVPASGTEQLEQAGSYRGGITPYAFFDKHPLPPTLLWADAEKRWQAFFVHVDEKLDAYSELFGVPLRCAFPRRGLPFADHEVKYMQNSLVMYPLRDNFLQVKPSLLLDVLPDVGTAEWEELAKKLGKPAWPTSNSGFAGYLQNKMGAK